MNWATFVFTLIIYLLSFSKYSAKSEKLQKIDLSKGHNSYKGGQIVMKICRQVELNKLNISSSKSFSLSAMVTISEAENLKKCHFWPLKGNNSYKTSSDNFDPMETFVELLILKKEGAFRFSLSIIVLEI